MMPPVRPSFTIGMEEEYLLVDRESRDVVSDPPREIFEQCAALACHPPFEQGRKPVGIPHWAEHGQAVLGEFVGDPFEQGLVAADQPAEIDIQTEQAGDLGRMGQVILSAHDGDHGASPPSLPLSQGPRPTDPVRRHDVDIYSPFWLFLSKVTSI